MADYTELTELMERIIHKYTQWENQKRTYGTDILFSRAEIHTLVAIGDHSGINVTNLAGILGITKGATSQMVYRLVHKGVVEKTVSPNSDSEVVLHLTADGKINYRAHARYHEKTNDASISLLKKMSPELQDELTVFFTQFEKIIDDKLDQ